MKIHYETGSLGEGRIEIEVSIHIDRHLPADRQSETISFGDILDFHERFEEILTLFLRNALTSIRDNELMGVGTTLLIFQPDASSCSSMLCRIAQQMRQDV